MARSRAAPRAAAPRAPAPAPAPVHHNTAAPSHPTPASANNAHAAPPQPQVTNIFVQRAPMAGGGGSGMLGTMAAVAGGSVIGHGISNYLYGHNNQAPTQPAEAQELARTAAQENHVCAPQLVGYSKCLEANPSSADSCKWAWDYFMQCQKEHPQPQQ